MKMKWYVFKSALSMHKELNRVKQPGRFILLLDNFPPFSFFS